MPWNFWQDAHAAALADVVSTVRPKWSKAFVGSTAALTSSCVVTAALHIYDVPGKAPISLLLSGTLIVIPPAIYVARMLKYPVDLLSRLKADLHELRGRLHSRDVAESSIIALSEHLAEMKLLQNERVRNPEQLAEWTERYQKLIQATYIILSRGVSNNVAMVYVSCPVVEPRYIRGCFNEAHMKAMFALEKYVDKLQCIIDGHFLTVQHTTNKSRPAETRTETMSVDGESLLAA